MSQKPPDLMTLVYLKKTNQVLSVATRQAVPEEAVPKGKETPEQEDKRVAAELGVLVGTQLLVRHLVPSTTAPAFVKEGISFAPKDLSVATVELVPAVLLEPAKYFIDPNNPPQIGADPSSILFTPAQTSLKIQLPVDITVDTAIWVEVHEGSQKPEIFTAEILLTAADLKKASINVQLAPNNYDFLILVTQYQPLAVSATIT